MKKITFIILFLYSAFSLRAQWLEGVISEKTADQQIITLTGASIYWFGTTIGTVSNEKGEFRLERISQTNTLIVQYVGYQTDTIQLEVDQNHLQIFLKTDPILEEVEIRSDQQLNTEVIQSELITVKELRKAACCNLSESFETNATVDVSISDAATGSKQLRLLGLDGIYAQIMTENLPSIRGLSSRTGLQFIPGTWIKSIDVNKGAGSVVQGYESITGQINVEYAQPDAGEKLLLNGYFNRAGRAETNLNYRLKLSDKWSTAFLLHHSNLQFSNDFNKDGFLDTPKFTQFNVLNRWKYNGDQVKLQFGLQALYESRTGGQVGFKKNMDRNILNPYGTGLDSKRIQGFAKIGFLPRKHPTQSLGIIASGVYHETNSFWGLSDYQGTQYNGLLNVIYQNNFAPKHELKAGFSYVFDQYQEHYSELTANGSQEINRYRQENVAGAFVEHTLKPSAKMALITGFRADWHNLFGWMPSPRLHFKYEITEQLILRVSGGRGFRTPNPLVEYGNYLISARNLILDPTLKPEVAWNYGLSISKQIQLGARKAALVLDYYRTDFENQLVLDLDASAHLLRLYNLNGKAYANSFQASLEYEWFKNFKTRMAYKLYDVHTTLSNGKLIEMPFIAKHRAFLNIAYEYGRYKRNWAFDFTAEWTGTQRLPNSADHPPAYRMPDRSPQYVLINAQVTKNFNRWAVYIGGENLGNYMQDMPVISAQDPYSQHFDAGMIYAPIMGTMLYTGFRFSLE